MREMKHKVEAFTITAFVPLFEELVKRLDQMGEEIVGSRFVFDDQHPWIGFRATIWTRRKEGR